MFVLIKLNSINLRSEKLLNLNIILNLYNIIK
jgi:hypothetical protein